jgi:hypothetical protein
MHGCDQVVHSFTNGIDGVYWFYLHYYFTNSNPTP